jgi:geranylgeranyl diphosphate synthase type I
VNDPYSSLERAITHVSAIVDAAIRAEKNSSPLIDRDLKEASFAYLERGGKRLRPLVTHLAAGAVGGNPEIALDAALAVEVFHTWTLIHDDLIDNDDRRRGGDTVHVAFRNRVLASSPGLHPPADNYGTAIAILAGDYLQGVAVRLLLDAVDRRGVSPATAHATAYYMQTEVLKDLVEGEVADVAFTHRPIADLEEADLVEMYRQKSGSLISFAARAGAMLALDEPDPDAEYPALLARFAELAGVAFQIQDDVLGIVGDEVKLGKPVGSDIREGKRTLVLLHAHREADADTRARLEAIVGRGAADLDEISWVRRLIERTGALEVAALAAEERIGRAVAMLEPLPPSPYRDRLTDWAHRLVRRES